MFALCDWLHSGYVQGHSGGRIIFLMATSFPLKIKMNATFWLGIQGEDLLQRTDLLIGTHSQSWTRAWTSAELKISTGPWQFHFAHLSLLCEMELEQFREERLDKNYSVQICKRWGYSTEAHSCNCYQRGLPIFSSYSDRRIVWLKCSCYCSTFFFLL